LPPVSFSSSFFSPFVLPLLSSFFFPFFFFFFLPFSFTPRTGKGGGHAKLLDHLGRQHGRRARSAAFSHNLPIGPRAHGSFICILRFFEVKLTRRLPLPTTTRLLARGLFLFPAPRARGPSRLAPSRLLGRSPRHGPPTQKTGDAFAVLAKYRGSAEIDAGLAIGRSIDRSLRN